MDTEGSVKRRRTILLVEDSDMNRETINNLLADDYEVLTADNGLTGFEQLVLRGEEIALILLDLYMPVSDGFEFLARKKADPCFDAIPVIIMTASSAVDDEIRCLELGASDFVTKPFNIQVMKNRMKSLIHLSESSAMLGRLETDSLTGLYTKEYFYHSLEELLRVEPGLRWDLVCSDVQSFRAMNDRYGTQYCDEFLRGVAQSLSERLPGLIFAGRIGADVFAFLIEHREDDWNEVLTQTDEENTHGHFVVKYGVYKNVDHTLSAAAICDRATLALAKIKQKFGIDVAYYDDEMRRLQQREHEIGQAMESALAGGEFVAYYQPKHDLRTGAVCGAEALVRWISPEQGFVSPGQFISLFERNGFITNLDFYIWEEVCRELRRCIDGGLPAVPVSVNVSRRDFDIPDLAGRIAELTDRYGLDHSLLHIEVTESMYSDAPEQITRTIEALHADGFRIELDDFGSGYSSLTSLSTLKLDVMKIDMSLICQAAETHDYSILRFATLLADGMRLKTVVEGAETEEQIMALRVLGCDFVQGYYYSRPLPAAEFEAYLDAHAGKEARA